jgi:hypothetical protein
MDALRLVLEIIGYVEVSTAADVGVARVPVRSCVGVEEISTSDFVAVEIIVGTSVTLILTAIDGDIFERWYIKGAERMDRTRISDLDKPSDERSKGFISLNDEIYLSDFGKATYFCTHGRKDAIVSLTTCSIVRRRYETGVM